METIAQKPVVHSWSDSLVNWLLWRVPASVFWAILLFGSNISRFLAAKYPSHADLSAWLSPAGWLIIPAVICLLLLSRKGWKSFLYAPYAVLFPLTVFTLTPVLGAIYCWKTITAFRRLGVVSSLLVGVAIGVLLWIFELRSDYLPAIYVSLAIRNVIFALTLAFLLVLATQPLVWFSTFLVLIDKVFTIIVGVKSSKRLDHEGPKAVQNESDTLQRAEKWLSKIQRWVETESTTSKQFTSLFFIVTVFGVVLWSIINFAVTFYSINHVDPTAFRIVGETQLTGFWKFLFYSLCNILSNGAIEFGPRSALASAAIGCQIGSNIFILTIYLLQFSINADGSIAIAKAQALEKIGQMQSEVARWRCMSKEKGLVIDTNPLCETAHSIGDTNPPKSDNAG